MLDRRTWQFLSQYLMNLHPEHRSKVSCLKHNTLNRAVKNGVIGILILTSENSDHILFLSVRL